MAKGSSGGSMGLGGGPGMLRQLQALQERMLAEQEALGSETVTASAGGGAVKVVMTGHQKLTDIQIQPELLTPDGAEMLAELVMAAVNQAVEQSRQLAAQRLGSLTRGLGLPPLGF